MKATTVVDSGQNRSEMKIFLRTTQYFRDFFYLSGFSILFLPFF